MAGSAACGLEEREWSDEVPSLEPDGPGGNAGGPLAVSDIAAR